MSPTTIHSIVDIPELAAGIACYLTAADVATAMVTCKSWSERLRPLLWANLHLRNTLPAVAALNQNKHLVRAINLDLPAMMLLNDIDHSDVASFLEILAHGLPIHPTHHLSKAEIVHTSKQSEDARIACCTNLRRIKLVFDYRPFHGITVPKWPCIQALLHHSNNTLTHLHMEVPTAHGLILSPFVQCISELCRLEHLTIRSNTAKTESWFLSLLRACLPLPRLSELYCNFVIESDDEDSSEDDLENEPESEFAKDITEPEAELKTILEEAITARASINGSIDVKIKALEFPDPKVGDIIRIVVPLLMSDLVEVETLKVPKLIPFRGKDLHEEMIRKLCPALRHLVIPRYALRYDGYSLNRFRPMVCTFIRGCLGLKTIQGEGFLHEESEGEPSRGIISTIHKYHSKTIEELEFSDCVAVGSARQQAILAFCKQLKRFWIVPTVSSVCRYGLQFQHILEHEWVCLGLRELSLTLNRHFDLKATIEAMRQESSGKAAGREELAYDKLSDAEKIGLALKASTWAAKRVCTQIGRLVALETLALGTDEEDVLFSKCDLTLFTGYLAELAGLKKLHQLHLRTDYWSKMGQAEVEFMDANWPSLDRVCFGTTGSRPHGLKDQPHWQWLLQKKPQLRFVAFVEK